jgi:hypothetical protein
VVEGRLRAWQTRGLATDDHRELRLVVHSAHPRRVEDGLARADHRRGRLEEEQRLLRHRLASLRRVIGVVAPDRDDLRGGRGCEQRRLGQRHGLFPLPGTRPGVAVEEPERLALLTRPGDGAGRAHPEVAFDTHGARPSASPDTGPSFPARSRARIE